MSGIRTVMTFFLFFLISPATGVSGQQILADFEGGAAVQTYSGAGTSIQVTSEQKRSGGASLKWEISAGERVKGGHYQWGMRFEPQDWSRWQRLVIWVYPVSAKAYVRPGVTGDIFGPVWTADPDLISRGGHPLRVNAWNRIEWDLSQIAVSSYKDRWGQVAERIETLRFVAPAEALGPEPVTVYFDDIQLVGRHEHRTIQRHGHIYTEIARNDEPDSLQPTPAEKEKGFVVYTRPDPAQLLGYSVPRREEVLPLLDLHTTALTPDASKGLRTFATPGEMQPLFFSVFALQDLPNVKVRVTPLVHETGKSSPLNGVQARLMSSWEQRVGQSGYRIVNELLERFDAVRIAAMTSQGFYLLISVP